MSPRTRSGRAPRRGAAIAGFAALVLLAPACGSSADGTPRASAPAGRWGPPLDWEASISVREPSSPSLLLCPDANEPGSTGEPGTGNLEFEISHAALMPTGTYTGWVLLWRKELPTSGLNQCNTLCVQNTSVLWALDPATLTSPVAIYWDGFTSNIFCGTQTWDELGQLVLIGGLPEDGCDVPGLVFPRDTYRFRPTSLSNILYPQPSDPDFYEGKPGVFEFLQEPVLKQGDMAIGRYYPGAIQTIGRTAEFSTGGTIEGGLTLVVGGPPQLTTPGGPTLEGNEIWEVLRSSATAVVAWETPFLPMNPADPDHLYGTTYPENSPHYSPAQFPQYDPYVRQANPPQPYPDRLIDSYPRMFQMPGGDILICGDMDSGATGGANAPGSTFVISPDYQTAQPTWESYQGPEGSPFAGEQLWHDSFYDCAVLLQQLTPAGRLARVLMFGGSRNDPAVGAWDANDEIWEFRPNGNSIPTGTWSPKFQGIPVNYVQLPGGQPAYPVFKRIWAHGVVLPTGEVFVVGGTSVDDDQGGAGHDTGDTTPVPPIIYDPGPPDSHPQDDGIVYEQPNTVADTQPAVTVLPRLYHSVAALLADGRVLVAGGKREYFTGPPVTVKPGQLGDQDPRFTGQVFSPPYLDLAGNGFAGRPAIDSVEVPILLTMTPQFETFEVDVTLSGQGNSIDRLVLLRPAADTHSFDSDQRYVELSFTTNAAGSPAQTLTVTPPAADEVPPGYYMLFVIESDGSAQPWHRVPSVAEFVLLRTP